MKRIKALVLGPHGSGKDVFAEALTIPYACDDEQLRYAGPTSLPLLKELCTDLPLLNSPGKLMSLEHTLLESGLEKEEAFDLLEDVYQGCKAHTVLFKQNGYLVDQLYPYRHGFSKLMYDYGRLLRKLKGNLVLVNKLKEQGTDIIVGLREYDECEELIKQDKPMVFWMYRPGYLEDDTLEFTVDNVLHWCSDSGSPFRLIPNEIGKAYLHQKASVYIHKIHRQARNHGKESNQENGTENP